MKLFPLYRQKQQNPRLVIEGFIFKEIEATPYAYLGIPGLANRWFPQQIHNKLSFLIFQVLATKPSTKRASSNPR